MNADYRAYEKEDMTKSVLSRGRVVIEHAKYVGEPGDGQFLRSAMFSY